MVVEFVGVSFAHSRAMRFFIVCHFGVVVTSVIQSTLSCRWWMRWTECRHAENDMRFATESSLHSRGCQGTNASDFITEQMQFIWIPTLQTTLFEHAKDSIHFGTHTSDKSTVEHFSAPKYFSTVKCNLKCFFVQFKYVKKGTCRMHRSSKKRKSSVKYRKEKPWAIICKFTAR